MTGRALVFSDPEIIRLASNDFVPAALDDWYQRRRDDAEGRFFRAVADQSPQKGKDGATRQGVYLLTAGGKLLGWKNYNNAKEMREVLRRGLAAFRALPEAERAAGAVTVGDLGRADAAFARTPSLGELVVDVFTRQLEADDAGGYRKRSESDRGHDRAARDRLWLTAAEVRTLVPERSRVGQQYPLPPAVARRLVRFHLIDNTRGEPPLWRDEDVRSLALRLTVEEADGDAVSLRLEGTVLLATDRDAAKAERGYDARLWGYLRYDRGQKKVDRFDVVALGEHWGEGRFTKGARPGRAPLGVAFRLATEAGGVPPQGAREAADYFGAK